MGGLLVGEELERAYPGVLSVLRFLRRSGRLSDIDKFASAPDADSALEILQQILSAIYRSYRPGGICHEDELKPDEVELYKFLCGPRCVEGGRLRVRCPRLPTADELERLRRALKSGELRPSALAAVALARSGRRS